MTSTSTQQKFLSSGGKLCPLTRFRKALLLLLLLLFLGTVGCNHAASLVVHLAHLLVFQEVQFDPNFQYIDNALTRSGAPASSGLKKISVVSVFGRL